MTKQISDQEMFDLMKAGWKGGLPFTVCGNGSLLRNTLNVRRALPRWCKQYGIQTVNDAGAGDLKWRTDMPDWPVKYRAFDLVQWHPSVTCLDITTTAMPPCDLILCRGVLNHIPSRVKQTLDLFRQSGQYLAATQVNKKDIVPGEYAYARLDLRRYLGEPLDAVDDGVKPTIWQLALWKL